MTFYWKPGQAFADYRDLFGYIFPGFALKGQNFNDYWHNCVCGNDGHPISNGPFYMSNYTQGQGMTLKKNPHWYGKKAGLNSIFFKIITDTNSEIQAMKGGEVDAIAPSPESALSTLVHQGEPQVQRDPQLHPGALGRRGQPGGQRTRRTGTRSWRSSTSGLRSRRG